MPFKKGESGNPRGRKPGIPNKTTTACKEALTAAFDGIGGVDALQRWAKENPGEFYKLWGRMLPIDANVKHAAVSLEDLVAGEAGAE